MITLKKDKAIIKIEKWEDVTSLAGYTPNLNPKNHKLESINGRYIFSEKINCGLSNCHTPHAKGYIVETKEGSITNIGKDCGKSYFGVDFETLSSQFDRLLTENENRDTLWNYSFKIDEFEDKLTELRQVKNADKIYKNSQELVSINGDCPNIVVRKIQELVKSRSNLLKHQKEATSEEIDAIEAREGRAVSRPYYIEETIASINELTSLYPENNLKEILINNITENLKLFKGKNIDLLSFEELKYWVKWFVSLENLFTIAEFAVSEGRKLLSKSNLEPFVQILSVSKEKTQFVKFLNRVTTL